MERINLLWTGGLDSTYRLVELSQVEVEIYPYYIVDATRGSIKEERRAIKKILNLLKNKPFVRAKINNVIEIPDSSISIDDEINSAHKYFEAINLLGSQYEYIACFAKQHNLILEVGIEGSHRSKASEILKKYGHLKQENYAFDDRNIQGIFRVDPSKCDKSAAILFENMSFPANLFQMAKIEEAETLRNLECEDILKSTWFCHRPIFGLPCGSCNPCKDAMNEGMGYRVPIWGRILAFLIRKPISFISRVSLKIKSL